MRARNLHIIYISNFGSITITL